MARYVQNGAEKIARRWRYISKKGKKKLFRHRESNPGLAGAVSVLLMRAANPSH
jgi:hypothetical protein